MYNTGHSPALGHQPTLLRGTAADSLHCQLPPEVTLLLQPLSPHGEVEGHTPDHRSICFQTTLYIRGQSPLLFALMQLY